MHLQYHHPARIRKGCKGFAREVEFKDLNFPIKIRDNQKIEKKYCINIGVFGYERKPQYPVHVSKKILSKDMLVYY